MKNQIVFLWVLIFKYVHTKETSGDVFVDDLVPNSGEEYIQLPEHLSGTDRKTTKLNRQIRDIKMFQDPCTRTRDCDYNRRLNYPVCYCDDQCVSFNDCCHDFFSNDTRVTDETKISEGAKNRTAVIKPLSQFQKYVSCRLDIINQPSRRQLRGYWIVSRCPETFVDFVIKNQCDERHLSPVSDKEGIVYVNSACALCHGIKRYQLWKIELICRKYEIEQILESLDKSMPLIDSLASHWKFVPPAGTRPRTCFASLSVIEERIDCTKFQNPVKIYSGTKGKFYRNINCVDNTQDVTMSVCMDMFNTPRFVLYPLTAIFNFKSLDKHDEPSCHQHKLPNSTKHICQHATCMKGSDDGQCKMQVLIKNYIFKPNIVMETNAFVDYETILRTVTLFTLCLPVDRFQIKIEQVQIRRHCYGNSENNTDFCLLNTTFTLLSTVPVSRNDIQELKKSLNRIEFFYSENLLTNITKLINSTVMGNFSDDVILPNRSDELYYAMYTIYDKDINQYLNLMSGLDNISYPHKFVRSCSFSSRLWHSEDSSNVIVEIVNALILERDTDDLNKDSHIVNKTSPNSETFVKRPVAEIVMTYTTMSVSSALLFLTSLVFWYSELYQTSTGRVSQNFMVVHFLFNISFMFGIGLNGNQYICRLFGVLNHYFILTSFAWLCLFVTSMSMSLCYLHKFQRSTKIKESLLPTQYYAIGYLSPLLIIIPSFCIDILAFPWIRIGYGGDICFPTEFPANIVIFVIPVVLSIAINLGLLSHIAVSLLKISKIKKHRVIARSRSYVLIYIRICFTSGVSWILGAIAELTGNDIVRYMFIIVCGLHGCIFSICMLSTNFVKDAIKEKLSSNSETIETYEIDELQGESTRNRNKSETLAVCNGISDIEGQSK